VLEHFSLLRTIFHSEENKNPSTATDSNHFGLYNIIASSVII
jgi:hypothetical protein